MTTTEDKIPEILTTKSQAWREFFAQYSEPYHKAALLVSIPIYLSWTWLDHILVPNVWKPFLILRIIVAFLLGLFFYLRTIKVVPVSLSFYIPAFVAMNGIAWMIPFTNDQSMGIYFTGYTLGLAVMGLFLFVSYIPFTILMFSCLISTTIGCLIFTHYSPTFILTHGGIACVTGVVFAYGVFEAKLRMLREIFKLMKKVESQNEVLNRYANTDFMTNTFNRRYLDQIKDKLSAEGRTYSVLFFDVNGLKRINDVYGHEAGDQYIIECCNLLKRLSRKTDIVIRQGGDELILICPATDSKQAEILINRIQAEESKIKIICKEEKTGEMREEPVHMSIGCASSDMYSKDQIIKAADDKMQLNKQRWYEEHGGKKYR